MTQHNQENDTTTTTTTTAQQAEPVPTADDWCEQDFTACTDSSMMGWTSEDEMVGWFEG